MASFSPQLPNVQDTGIPNLTGVSQGTGPNKTFDAIFSGLTKTAINTQAIADVNEQKDIRTDAQGVFDSTNQEFGLNPPTPGSMQSELERMQSLQAAVDQGKISEVNYYGRLATLSKQLRSKYPGYEDIVDQTIQQVTGTRPANAYRDAIFQQIGQAQADASSEEKYKRTYDKENAGILSVLYGDDYFANPSKYNFNKTQADVARWKGRATKIDADQKDLALMASQNEFNDKRATKAVDQDFSFIVDSSLNHLTGANGPSAQAQIDQFVANGGGTPEELNTFITNISKTESDLRAQLIIRGRQQYVATGIMKQDDVNKAIDAAMYPLTKAKEAVLGGDFKLASKFATINKAITDQQSSELFQDPTYRAGMGLNTISQVLGETFITNNPDNVTHLQNLATEIAGQTIAGRQNIVKNTVELGNDKLSRQVLDTSFKALQDPNLKGKDFSNLVDQYFGKDAVDFMSPKVVASEDLETIFTKFLNPNVTAAIVQRGSKEDLEKYTNWALDKVASIPAFRAAAGDVNTVSNFDNLTVTFDPKTMRVVLSNSDNSANSTENQFYGRTANAFNKVMTVMQPILEANGIQGEDVAKRVLERLNVSTGPHSTPSIFKKMWDSLPSDLTAPLSSKIPNAGQIIQEVPDGSSPIDFLSPIVKGAKQIGSDLMTPIPPAPEDQVPASEHSSWLQYDNHGVRSQPLSRKLIDTLGKVVPEMGLTMSVFSGGQDSSGPHRTGSHRHDHGNAADVFIYKDGHKLDWANSKDRPVFEELVRRARAAGITGIGAGEGYMRPGSMHIGFGPPVAWGRGGHSENAPFWLVNAFNGN